MNTVSERPPDPGPPIATRLLRIVEAGRATEVPIRLFAPAQEADRAWSCWFEIGWPEGVKGMRGYGADAMQALTIALHLIGTELYTSDYHDAGTLVGEAPGKGYGFPVPSGIRDLLVGDDAKYF